MSLTEERRRRYENDWRFLRIATAFGEHGYIFRVYMSDALGVRHCIDGRLALTLCGEDIPPIARIEHMFPTCIRCVVMGG